MTAAFATDPPPGWQLRRRLAQLLAAFALVVVALVVIIVIAAGRFVVAGNQVINRWQPARLASQQLLGDLVNEESGVRGYVITHRSASLQPYREYHPLERVDRTRLRSLIGDDQRLQAMLRLELARAREWHSGYVAAALRDGGRGSAGTRLDAGRLLFDRIRAAATPLDDAITGRVAAARHDRTVTGIVSVVVVAVGVALVTAAGLFLRRGLRSWVLRPVSDLGAQTRVVAAGELGVAIEPHGPDELVRLGLDVEAMRTRLIDELQRAETISADLRRQGAELERSNADLQQFAYVASHDLSEPLRKVSNFCQLLERQYGPHLDDRARQYIFFAVDAAQRMQALINDLLALSRVGRTTESFAPVDLDHVLDRALSTLADRIDSTGAAIERSGPLPVVTGDRSLLVSLFENLVGNAIKYHRDDVAPVVTLSSTRSVDDGTVTVRISDNGIGIDPQYAERIFAVFQRLHLRDRYGGTGIGLALCRRIVDFHGGKIELDSAASDPGRGATFVITLPAATTLLVAPQPSAPRQPSLTTQPLTRSSPEGDPRAEPPR